MAEPFTLRAPPSITRPTAYHFRFAVEGWAIFTLNDETCEFTVQSDWGVYGFRWSQCGLGERTLTEFIATANPDYLLSKLQLGTRSKELEDVIDCDATLAVVQEEIASQFRDGRITGRQESAYRDSADEWNDNDFDFAACDSELEEFLGYLPEYIRMKPTGWYLVLRDQLLPFFSAWLRENVVAKQEAAHG